MYNLVCFFRTAMSHLDPSEVVVTRNVFSVVGLMSFKLHTSRVVYTHVFCAIMSHLDPGETVVGIQGSPVTGF